jgi:hypothetical protein
MMKKRKREREKVRILLGNLNGRRKREWERGGRRWSVD